MFNALVSYFFSISFPEELPEEKWWQKIEQYILLNNKNFLPVKTSFDAEQKK